MRWGRNLFRLWILFSVCWIALVGVHAYRHWWIPRQIAVHCADTRKASPSLGDPSECFDPSLAAFAIIDYAAEAIVPAALILMIGFVGVSLVSRRVRD